MKSFILTTEIAEIQFSHFFSFHIYFDVRTFYFLRCIEILDDIPVSNDDQKKGVEIVRHALQQPTRQIADNAGEDASVVVNKVRTSHDQMNLLIVFQNS